MAVGNRGTPELRISDTAPPGQLPLCPVVAGRRGGPDAASATTVVRIGRGFPRSPPDGPLPSSEDLLPRLACGSCPRGQLVSPDRAPPSAVCRTSRLPHAARSASVEFCAVVVGTSGCSDVTGSLPDRDRASGRMSDGRETRCGLSARRATARRPPPLPRSPGGRLTDFGGRSGRARLTFGGNPSRRRRTRRRPVSRST